MCESFGEKVSRLREARGWNHTDLSRASGVARATIIRVEKNPALNMNLAQARRIAIALGTSLDFLAGTFEHCGSK